MSSPHLLLFVFEKFLFFTYTLIASRDTVTVKGAEKTWIVLILMYLKH